MGSVAAGPRASERPEAKNLLWLTAPGRTGFHKEEAAMPKTINRRDALKLALAGGVATTLQACGSRLSHDAHSNAETAPRFEAALRIPPVLEPTRSDEYGEYYEIEARESSATILPGKHTMIWVYNGIFPGRCTFRTPRRPTALETCQ